LYGTIFPAGCHETAQRLFEPLGPFQMMLDHVVYFPAIVRLDVQLRFPFEFLRGGSDRQQQGPIGSAQSPFYFRADLVARAGVRSDDLSLSARQWP
jgi:hypothetical protein